MGNNCPWWRNTGSRVGVLLSLTLSMLLLSSCWGIRTAARAARAIQSQATQSAVPIKAMEPTPRPSIGPFTISDAVALADYILWFNHDVLPFWDATGVNRDALADQNTRVDICGIALVDASTLLQEASNQHPPDSLRQTHSDMTRMFQEWELARSEMAQYCSGSDGMLAIISARYKTFDDLGVSVSEDMVTAMNWLSMLLTPEAQSCPELFTVTVDWTNLRAGASEEDPLLRVAYKGDSFRVGEPKLDFGWLHVRDDDTGQWYWVLETAGKIEPKCTVSP